MCGVCPFELNVSVRLIKVIDQIGFESVATANFSQIVAKTINYYRNAKCLKPKCPHFYNMEVKVKNHQQL